MRRQNPVTLPNLFLSLPTPTPSTPMRMHCLQLVGGKKQTFSSPGEVKRLCHVLCRREKIYSLILTCLITGHTRCITCLASYFWYLSFWLLHVQKQLYFFAISTCVQRYVLAKFASISL